MNKRSEATGTPNGTTTTYSAPMSYAGFTKRLYAWLRRPRPLALEVLAWVAAIVSAAVMWIVVLPVWYIIFVVIMGWITVPYRLVRRSQREQKEDPEQGSHRRPMTLGKRNAYSKDASYGAAKERAPEESGYDESKSA